MSVLATVNGGERDVRVLETARELSTALDEQLTVLHVMSDERFSQRRKADSEYYHDDAAADARVEAQRRTEEILDFETLDNVPGVTADGSVGDAAVKILEKASHIDARYVVVGGRKRTPVGKALFGSVTQSVLLGANCPVVAVTGEP